MLQATTRRASMATALDVTNAHGGAVAALRARGVDHLGDDLASPAFVAFLTNQRDGATVMAECIALGFLWRELEAEAEDRAPYG